MAVEKLNASLPLWRRLRREAGAAIRELQTHTSRCTQWSRDRRLVVFPCGTRWEGSSMLWRWELGKSLRHLGWRVTVVPPQISLAQRRRIVRLERPDCIMHIKARHPLNRPVLYPGPRHIFVLDDADYLDSAQIAPLQECCRDADIVIAGSQAVADWASTHSDNVKVIWVSHPVPARRAIPRPEDRNRIVAWAHANPLAYHDEADLVREVMVRVCGQIKLEFWLYGIRDRAAALEYCRPIAEAGGEIRLVPFISRYRKYLDSLSQVAVGLHPICMNNPYSRGKSWGKILSYFASDVSVVTPPVLDHKQLLRHRVNAMTPNDVQEWEQSIVELLTKPKLRQKMADAGWLDFTRHLSSDRAASELTVVLSALGSAAQPYEEIKA